VLARLPLGYLLLMAAFATFVVWFLSATWESDVSFIWLDIWFGLPQGAIAGVETGGFPM